MSDSHINKRIKMLEAQIEAGQEKAQKGKTRGWITMGIFVGLMVIYQLLINFGVITTEQRMSTDLLLLGCMMGLAAFGTRYWAMYSRGRKEIRAAEEYMVQYKKLLEKDSD